MFKLPRFHLPERQLPGPALACFDAPSEKHAAVFAFIPVIMKKVAGRDAVPVDEDKMAAPRSVYRVVEDDVFPPTPVFMPEMENGLRRTPERTGNDVADRCAGAVVCDDDLKIGERLACASGKNKPEDLRLVVHRNNKCDIRNQPHVPIYGKRDGNL